MVPVLCLVQFTPMNVFAQACTQSQELGCAVLGSRPSGFAFLRNNNKA
jgi:hypothetical protein